MSVLPEGAFGERVARRLREAYVIWLTTVANDGTPQPNPVWFIWDGADSMVVYNRADSHRMAHIATRPQIALHLDGNGRGGDVVVLAATAHRDPELPAPHENAEYLAKYADGMMRVSGSLEQFSVDYSVPLRIQIRRIRGF
ncbi:MAG TPA: TIGR03667 family PPOX class F420-dependent oxidoreductase [Jatrophihabitans sp.]|jgi:PPOX class probable F420-dependent enzyme|nr:TIGR03667 family PPOX class F420-dependent oxidoreductase [Jatrophihabitans sp.]